MSTFRSTLIASFLAGLAIPNADAHHSAAMFDFTKSAEMHGVVKEIRVINPHMSLTLAVTDSRGTRAVEFEGHSVNNFYRAGWRSDSVKAGDTITVRFAPRKDGHDGGFVNAFTTAKGQEIGFKLPGAPEPLPAAKPAPK